MIAPLTEETAAAERRRILSEVHYHRAAARRRLRDLQALEAACRRHGIRLVREPAAKEAEAGARAHPHHRRARA